MMLSRPSLFGVVLFSVAVGGSGGCSQADDPQIPKVAAPAPPQNSKPLAIPKRGGQTYGASSKYQELMNKKDEQ